MLIYSITITVSPSSFLSELSGWSARNCTVLSTFRQAAIVNALKNRYRLACA
jgi:hypothetical protein